MPGALAEPKLTCSGNEPANWLGGMTTSRYAISPAPPATNSSTDARKLEKLRYSEHDQPGEQATK